MGDQRVPDSGAPDHLSDIDLSGFLDHDLDADTRRRVTAHLDACDRCRLELIEVRRLAASYGPSAAGRLRRAWAPVAGVALAAVLAAVVLLPRAHVPAMPAAAPVRSAPQADGDEGRLRIECIAPVNDATVAAATLVFVWHPAAADVYRLTLLSESGAPVWSRETTDTSVTVPSGTALGPGVYFWRVDAVANGITATTGIHRLIVAR